MCQIDLLNFAHRLNYKIIELQHFKSWILLLSSGKKGGRGQNAYLLGLLVKLASDLDSYNFEMPGIRPTDNDNHLREITHKCTDSHPACL
jgi:hypothetical protein